MPIRLKHGGLASKLKPIALSETASLSEMFSKGSGRFIRADKWGLSNSNRAGLISLGVLDMLEAIL